MNDSEPRSVAIADMFRDEALGKALLGLNNAHAQELSWLEAERLEYLISEAFLARRIGHVDAFLLAFDQDARYDSPNFIWFRARYPRFVYVDRIVVARSRVRGPMAICSNTSSTPDTIVLSARSTRYPPNPASDAFHAAVGFVEIGTASVHGGSRTVRYLSHTPRER